MRLKRTMAALLTAAMGLTMLTACGGSGGSSGGNSGSGGGSGSCAFTRNYAWTGTAMPDVRPGSGCR